VGRFRIAAGNGIDAVGGTDGIEATGAALGPAFPHGLFIAQDDSNGSRNQNFKLGNRSPDRSSRRCPSRPSGIREHLRSRSDAGGHAAKLSRAGADRGSPRPRKAPRFDGLDGDKARSKSGRQDPFLEHVFRK